jgi:transposase InsO family protein
MVLGDYFSKWKEAFAIPNHTAQTVADKLVTEFICRFGSPYRIHTDQGRELVSDLFSEVCSSLGIAKSHTTPYHSQSDGMIERFNGTLQQMLTIFVDGNTTNWDDHLPYLMMAYRATVHESTKCTPKLIMLAREIILPIDVMTGSLPVPDTNHLCYNAYVEWIRNAMETSFVTVHSNLMSSFKRQKKYYDVILNMRTFSLGD